MVLKVKCPVCGREVRWTDEFPYRPFCSRRCRLIDLGERADERNVITESLKKDEMNSTEEDMIPGGIVSRPGK